VIDADLTWDDGAANGIWGTAPSDSAFTGSRWVPGGNAAFGAAGAGPVTISGTQQVNDLAVTAAGYTFAGGGLELTTTGSWAIGSDTSIAAVISGSGGFAKWGAGRLTLAGANTFTGGALVNAGVLLVDGSTPAGSGLSVASGAVIGGSGTISGDLALATGALLAFAPGTTLTLGGSLTLDSSFGVASLRDLAGGAVDWSSIVNGTYKLLDTGFTFSPATISNFGLSNAFPLPDGRQAYFQNGSLELVVVPEPGTLALAVAGIGLFVTWAFRRRPLPDRRSISMKT
jgi:autotransporter-associated beta strand protein